MQTPFDNAVNDLNGYRDVFDVPVLPTARKVCPFCKTELEDYEDTYFVGCPACYNTFNQEIKRDCLQIHGKNKHVGKIPEKYKTIAGKQAELQQLEFQKSRAVEMEDYELANLIKQKIAKIKGEIYGY